LFWLVQAFRVLTSASSAHLWNRRLRLLLIALLTKLQMSIVSEMAESENLWTAEYPIALREVRASIVEAFQELDQA